MPDSIEQAAELLAGASRLLVFTGAGVSTESGIPDFRGPEGLWTKLDPDEFTIDRYLSSPDVRKRSWQRWAASPLRRAQPNRAHLAVAELARKGRLEGCVTQNIDGLHQAAGLAGELVVEVHGNAWTAACLVCGDRRPAEEVHRRVEAGDEDPRCSGCGGIVKLAVVSFGQAMPAREMDRAYAMAARADGVLAAGTTLSVWPAADIPLTAVRRGAPFVIVNMGRTDFDHAARLKIERPAGEALSRLAGLLQQGRKAAPLG